MKIDFKHARGVFEDYLNGYDREDEKIKLKIIHTYGVVKSAREIGHRMHLNEEDQQLAELLPCFTILEDSNSFVFITAFHRTLWITLHSVYNCYLREKIR